MNYLTHQLLNAEEVEFIKQELEQEAQDWEDGKNTAGTAPVSYTHLTLPTKA